MYTYSFIHFVINLQCLKSWEDAIREIQAKDPILETTKLDSIESSSQGDKESTETEKIESDG